MGPAPRSWCWCAELGRTPRHHARLSRECAGHIRSPCSPACRRPRRAKACRPHAQHAATPSVAMYTVCNSCENVNPKRRPLGAAKVPEHKSASRVHATKGPGSWNARGWRACVRYEVCGSRRRRGANPVRACRGWGETPRCTMAEVWRSCVKYPEGDSAIVRVPSKKCQLYRSEFFGASKGRDRHCLCLCVHSRVEAAAEQLQAQLTWQPRRR